MITETRVKQEKNPEDDLSNPRFVTKYQRDFVTHFLPKYCVGIKLAQQIGDNIRVEARLSTLGKLSRKSEKFFLVPVEQVEVWRKNVRLYSFVAGGKR